MAVQGVKLSGLARALSEGKPGGVENYRPRSILLTGGAGFIASHVVIRLVNAYPSCKVREHATNARSAILGLRSNCSSDRNPQVGCRFFRWSFWTS